MGDELTNLYLQASSYAKAKTKQEATPAISQNVRIALGAGAGLLTLILVGLVARKRYV